MKTAKTIVTATWVSAALGLTLAACTGTTVATSGCSQIEMANGITGADCGTMTTSELAALAADS